MIAATAPVWISRHRIHGAEAARQNGADLIIMDDGHQNPDLHKDISIVVVDGEAGWGNGRVFPAGPLREPVTQGLNRADAVILMVPHEGFEPDYDGLHLAELEIPVLKAWLEPANPAPTDPVLAFAGIGRPEKFFHSLSAAGAKLTDTRSFPDHHAYSASDLAKLRKAADQLSSQLITTEKDLVRIPPEHRETILAWPVKAEFSEPARLTAMIQEALDAAAARR